MKSILIALLFCAPGLAWAATPPRKASGKCLALAQIQSSMDPVVLTASLVDCVRADQMDAAVDLFNVAGAFARFDTLRVPDKTAYAAWPALTVMAGNAMTATQRNAFNVHLKRRSNAPGYHDTLCAFTAQLTPPTYNPLYMTRHGMGSFLGSPTAQPFSAPQAWSKVRSQYLGCPSR